MSEPKTLPQIVDLSREETSSLLKRVNFGHLGVCKDDRPYVVPIHFAYAGPEILFFTTEGMKTEIIDANPTVCLQVEDIRAREDWESVMITGTAHRLTSEDEIESAMKLIKKINPRLSPAWSIRWMDDWIRSNVEVVYRISPDTVSGRKASAVKVHAHGNPPPR
jgi:nitroimidazol reductase NimA-like FMN-containing flavoprotein (pyridoxamine 5'-phosphate oxidase superfamily)